MPTRPRPVPSTVHPRPPEPATPPTATTPGATSDPDDLLWVTAWEPHPADHGHDPRSPYVEQFWLGILGPSTVWLLRHCAHELDDSPDGFVLDLPLVASTLGLGHRGGRNSPLSRSLARAVRFGMARETGDRQLQVRRRLPHLSRGQLARLPTALQHRHQLLVDHRAPGLDRETSRARCLAAALAACGEPPGRIEAGLGLLGVHPHLAAEAARALERAPGRSAAVPHPGDPTPRDHHPVI